MSIDPQELERCFAELAGMTPAQQVEALRALQLQQPELARRLAPLLDAHAATGDPVERLREATLQQLAAFAPETLIGRQLGDWTLTRLVGRGGMGVVYAAHSERDGITRHAALKLLAAPLFDPRATQRFIQEARALARLDHPGICRLRDWGHTAEGWPYLVLDLIDGHPLPADGGGRPLRERLLTMARIADAVAAAHRQLVAHLDLKPGNVLMTAVRGPVLLDFGVSRMLNDDAGGTVTLTRWMTPGYASPEQLRGEPASATTDIYALGVMLYEQVTAVPPFDLAGVPVTAALQRIEQGAVPPSRRAGGLPRDLDAICARAMHADPGRRYASADALAEDLRALLERRPVSARPDRLGYRLTRLFARHPLALPAALVAIAAVTGLAVMLALQAGDLRAQRDRAEAAAHRAQAAMGLLLGSIKAADPTGTAGPRTSIGDVLSAAQRRADAALADQPQARARILQQIADVRRDLGDDAHAVPLYRSALQALSRPAGSESGLRAGIVAGLATALRHSGQLRQAGTLLDTEMARPGAGTAWRLLQARAALRLEQGRIAQAMHDLRRALTRVPGHGNDRAAVLSNIGYALVQAGDYPQARGWYRRAVVDAQRAQPLNREQLATALLNLADSQSKTGQVKAALANSRRALALRKAMYGEHHARTISSYTNLAFVLIEAGHWNRALVVAHHAAALEQALSGGDSRRMLNIWNAIGLAGERKGDHDLARRAFKRAVHIARQRLPADHPLRASLNNNLANSMMEQGDYQASLAPLHRAYDVYRRIAAGKPSRGEAIAGINIAESLLRLGRRQQALDWATRSLQQAERVLKPGQWLLADIRQIHAETLLAAGARAQAEREALQVERAFAASTVKVPRQAVRENLRLLRDIYVQEGRAGEAASYRRKLAVLGGH